MSIGIVVLAYGKRAKEPNPVNRKLGQITDEFVDWIQSNGQHCVVVAQHEVVGALSAPPTLVVTQQDATNHARNGTLYLDTKDVLEKAFEVFRKFGITDVVVVANPFLHLQAAKAMVKEAGFELEHYSIPGVGFDNHRDQLQWWCKGPIRFVAYLGIQVLGKLTGQNFHGLWEKKPSLN